MTCKACGYDDQLEEEPPTIDYTYKLEHPEAIPEKFVEIRVHSTDGYTGLSHSLYACPKCGTVKMEV